MILVVFSLTFRAQAGELEEAINAHDFNRVKQLLEVNPILISQADNNNVQPLHEAAMSGTSEIVEYLLSKGADVNARGYNKNTPLHVTDDAAIARVLIDHGADLDALNAVDETPLQMAVSEENMALVNVLVAAGSKLDFDSLVQLGRADEVAAMLEKKPWLAKAPRTPLIVAASKGDLKMAELLLRYGADPDYADPDTGGTALYSAVQSGTVQVAKMLLDHGAEADIGAVYSDSGYTVLEREPAMLRVLLEPMVDAGRHGARVSLLKSRGGSREPIELDWAAAAA